MGGKNRKYLVYISISCSGPEKTEKFKLKGIKFRERSGADLRYTTSDCDWFFSHVRGDAYTKDHASKHIRLINPTSGEFADALSDSLQFLSQFLGEKDWDGGGLVLIYAGHGLKQSGSLVFTKKCLPLEARDMLFYISNIIPRSGRRLRIDAFFDSCYSGGFVANLLHAAHNEFNDLIFPCTLFAASLPDEPALESDKLKHGVFTYSYMQADNVPSLSQPRWLLIIKMLIYTKLGKNKLRLIEGGVSNLTDGRQHSIEYENGYLEVHSKGAFRIESDSYEVRDLYEALSRAKNLDKFEEFSV